LDTACNALSAKKVFELRDTEPLLNVGALYAVQQGGVVPYTFVAIPQLHGFVLTRGGYRRFKDVPDRKLMWGGLATTDPATQAPLRAGLLTSLASSGAAYQDVVFYGTAADREQISRRGYDTDFARDGLWIGHYRGCPMSLDVQFETPRSAPLIVEYGWHPIANAAESRVIAASDPPSADRVSVEWKSAPCGDVWVRAGLDKDGSGRWKPGDGACEGAGADGRLLLQRTADAAKARCVFGP
jgi:hypothetical protein